jgi:endogenous inhibitor of DNA gyrase (YacG/DUF329 family)
MTNPIKKIICPTCQKKETWTPENVFRPFCSERCKLIDLGAWASEEHRIAGEEIPPDDTTLSSNDEEK